MPLGRRHAFRRISSIRYQWHPSVTSWQETKGSTFACSVQYPHPPGPAGLHTLCLLDIKVKELTDEQLARPPEGAPPHPPPDALRRCLLGIPGTLTPGLQIQKVGGGVPDALFCHSRRNNNNKNTISSFNIVSIFK